MFILKDVNREQTEKTELEIQDPFSLLPLLPPVQSRRIRHRMKNRLETCVRTDLENRFGNGFLFAPLRPQGVRRPLCFHGFHANALQQSITLSFGI